MAITKFPSVLLADEHGLLAVGGDLEVESLLLAYSQGIFPWPIDEQYPLAWFSPDPRGVFFTENLILNRTTEKFLKRSPFRLDFNTNFESVILNCARTTNRKGQQGTWITPAIIEAYIEMHRQGLAYSVETYLEDKLVGGLYGVCLNGYFSGESMFYSSPNASKFALIKWVERLSQHGISWLDTQMVTPVVSSLGGLTIPRSEFLALLQTQIRRPCNYSELFNLSK